MDIFEIITPHEAMLVLHRFIKKHEEYTEEIKKIALELVSDTDIDEVAKYVNNSLNYLQVEELWDRSGKTRYGYVEPSEEAWIMIEEALFEYVDAMKKYQKSGLHRLAKTYCMGIIKGIKDYDSNSLSEFSDWAVDAPYEFIERVFDEWKINAPDEKDIDEVQSLIE